MKMFSRSILAVVMLASAVLFSNQQVNAMNSSQVRVVDPVLTSVVQGYRNQMFVGMSLFPSVPVDIAGGQVIEFGKESFRQYNSLRAPGSGTKRVQFGYLGKPFALENHSLEGQVPREHQRDASQAVGVDLGSRAANLAFRGLALGLEIQQAALVLDATKYDVNHKVALAGADKWSDPASTPATDIETGKEAIRASIGMYPNVLVLSPGAFAALKHNAGILERFKYTSRESITEEMLAMLFGVQKVHVGMAVKASDAGAFSDVWGNNAVLAYVPAGSDLGYSPTDAGNPEEPSFAYTYVMRSHPLVEQAYYDHNTKSWVYPVSYERAPVLSGITAGYLIQNPA